MDILGTERNFASLGLADLVAARDLYHWHLTHQRNVVGTAVGLYYIRTSDPWPSSRRTSTTSPAPGTRKAPPNLPELGDQGLLVAVRARPRRALASARGLRSRSRAGVRRREAPDDALPAGRTVRARLRGAGRPGRAGPRPRAGMGVARARDRRRAPGHHTQPGRGARGMRRHPGDRRPHGVRAHGTSRLRAGGHPGQHPAPAAGGRGRPGQRAPADARAFRRRLPRPGLPSHLPDPRRRTGRGRRARRLDLPDLRPATGRTVRRPQRAQPHHQARQRRGRGLRCGLGLPARPDRGAAVPLPLHRWVRRHHRLPDRPRAGPARLAAR